jgi:[lysine-biosynthesis-protein LysW]---L-2-aminoadipate ligase
MALRAAGLPVPRTTLALTPDAGLEAIEALGYPVVIKPLVGSWGRLVTAVRHRSAAVAVLEYIAALPSPQSHIVYAQEMVGTGDQDIRAIVIGGEVVGAIHRRSDEWRSNVALGARTEPCELTTELRHLARSAAQAVGAEVAGVDLLTDDDGRLVVLEVNAGVEFSGFQQAMGDRIDVADELAELVRTRMSS